MPFRIFIELLSNLYAKEMTSPNLLRNRFKHNKLKRHLYFIYRQNPGPDKGHFAGYVKNCLVEFVMVNHKAAGNSLGKEIGSVKSASGGELNESMQHFIFIAKRWSVRNGISNPN